MGKLFGTDGVRGVANRDLTGKLAMQIGQAAGMVVKNSTGRRPSVLVGKDTRISSDLLEAALTAGLCAAGADVVHLGVLPTPAVAYLVTKYSADAGIMISASHNPYPYNGIKIFNSQGYKLSDEQEGEIEQLVLGEEPFDPPAQDGEIGRVFSQEGRAAEDYAAYLCGTLAGDLSGLRVALDCANGSASVTAGRIFQSLGADCRILHAFPNGVNINDRCGSTHLESLRQAVLEGGFDVGLAFDGDADRCLAVDEQGGLVDGDRLMALFAYHLQSQGKLHHDTFVATVMSNLGLFKFAESHHMGPGGGPVCAGDHAERGFLAGGRTVGTHHFPRVYDHWGWSIVRFAAVGPDEGTGEVPLPVGRADESLPPNVGEHPFHPCPDGQFFPG